MLAMQADGVLGAQQLKAWMPPPGPEVEVLVCGPPAFNDAIAGLVTQLGYELPPDAVFG
jgi:hypothetical protein